MLRTGSKKIVVNAFSVNAAQVEEMWNGTRVITNPTLEEFDGFVNKEAGKLGSHQTRFVVDKQKGNVHFAHAAKAVHPDIVRHFDIADDHARGFMRKGGITQHDLDGFDSTTKPLLKRYLRTGSSEKF